MRPRDLVVEVVEVQGRCPIHRVGDRFLVRGGYRLAAEGPVCFRIATVETRRMQS